VDALDKLGLCEAQKVVVALQRFGKALPAEVDALRQTKGRLIEPVLLDLCPHGPVENKDAVLERVFEIRQSGHRGILTENPQ